MTLVEGQISSVEKETNHIKAENGRDLTIYAELMDAALKAKAASIMPYFGQVSDKSIIVDVGSGTGQLAEYVAGELHTTNVYAVDFSHDMLALANDNLSKINLVYDDATRLDKIPNDSVDIMYHGTVGHEIQTFAGSKGLNKSINSSFRCLKPGGREIWRDFAKPPEKEVYLDILTNDGFNTVEEAIKDGFLDYSLLSTKALFDCFYKQFKGGKSFNYEIVEKDGRKLIKMPAKYAQEFILRKDYTANWRQEIEEEYTYWTQTEAKAAFEEAGFTKVEIIDDDNEYIRKNRLNGKVILYIDDEGKLKPINFTTHMIIVAHKNEENTTNLDAEKIIKAIDFQSLLDSIKIKNESIKIDDQEFPIGKLLGQGEHKQVYLLNDGENNKVIKIPRKDKTTFYSAFSSIQQSIEKQYVLEKFGVKYMKIYGYDGNNSPYRFLIQEKIPTGSICASDLIKNGELKEENIAQMAEIINKFENSKEWQLDTNPFNWFRIKKDGKTEMVYTGGTVYRYNEAWSFNKVGLLQWVDQKYIESGKIQSAKVPNQKEANNFARNWQNLNTQYALWWKKYLNKNTQPQLTLV
ncbi:MAG: methyltransferase domain-containing protein [Candidatus Shapirobacteria bacterium]|nr:methyltransferase domain-containing protein [Candidatus Shapirobacteria bacterium]